MKPMKYLTVGEEAVAATRSIQMKLANAKRAKLSPTAMLIYVEGKASLKNAEEMAKAGFDVREPSVFLPVKPKAKAESEKSVDSGSAA